MFIKTGYLNVDGSSNIDNLIYIEGGDVDKILRTPSRHGSKPTAYGVAYSGVPNPAGGAPLSGVQTVVPGGVVIPAASTSGNIDLMHFSGIGDCGYFAIRNQGESLGCVLNNPTVGTNIWSSLQGNGLVQLRQVTERSGCSSTNFYMQSDIAKANGDELTDHDVGWAPITTSPWLGENGAGDTNQYPIYLYLPEVYRNTQLLYGYGVRHVKGVYPRAKSYMALNLDPTPGVTAFKNGRAALEYLKHNYGIDYVEITPGFATVPQDATDAEILAYVQSSMANDYGAHHHGGLSMGKLDSHGNLPAGAVTDSHTRVGGVNGLYIAGAAVWPL